MDLTRAPDFRNDPEARLRSELVTGERLLWSARPNGIGLAPFAIWLFAIPWTAFSLFWMAMAGLFTMGSGNGMFSFFPLFGLPFLAIGIYMLAQPFIVRGQHGRTLYAITDQRVIRLSTGRRYKIETIEAERIQGVEADEAADGSGTLKLTLANDGGGRVQQLNLLGVPDVAKARRLIAETARG